MVTQFASDTTRQACHLHSDPASCRQTGVGMVEVLVALVVMSVGMLGIASLYVTTLQAKTTSLSRMKAVNLAYDMADRIRANPTAGASYAITATTSLSAPGVTCIQTASTAAVTCTDVQMAQSDLFQWSNMVTDAITGLPGGPSVKRVITDTPRNGTTPEILTITLTWREAATSTNDLTYALQVQI